MCGLQRENIDQLFGIRSKTKLVSSKIKEITSLQLNLGGNVAIGYWLKKAHTIKQKWRASIIDAAIWNIWRPDVKLSLNPFNLIINSLQQ